MRVLIVDDDRPIRELFSEILAIFNHTSEESRTYVEAMKAIDAGGVEAVICDGFFPFDANREDEELWQDMASACQARDTPIVIASSDPEIVERANRRGLIALTKGFHMGELELALKAAIIQEKNGVFT